VPPIGPAGIPEREVLHDSGKLDVGHLNGQMDVIRHQAESMDAVSVTLSPFLQKEEEAAAVFVVCEDILFAVSSENDMIQRAGIMKPRFPCHAQRIADKSNNASLTRFLSGLPTS